MKFSIFATTALVFISFQPAFAQKQVSIKKNEIKVNGEKVAVFDGKGGNVFRMGSFTITANGASTPSITLKEDQLDWQNPLFDEHQYYYEVKFASGQTTYYRAAPVTKKFMGNTMVLYPRLTGSDIMEALFNDNMPVLINSSGVNQEAVEKFIKEFAFDKEKRVAEVRDAETAMATIPAIVVARDVKKPVVFKSQPSKGDDLGTWFLIEQDNVVIGRLYKKIGNEAVYQVWKKAPAGFQIAGKDCEFVPVVCTENLSKGTGELSGKFVATKVIGKGNLGFSAANPNAAEQELVTAVIAAGLM